MTEPRSELENVPGCPTERCNERVTKWNYPKPEIFLANYHGFGRVPTCEHCGGAYSDGEWKHRCGRCNTEVKAGELVGLFVPSRCKSCQDELVEKDKKSNNRCLKCGAFRINCCC